MIHHKINKIQSPWGKGFLTSILGTTISIILTFGTSALIDSKMKADTQRQTAMMVIHDIDVCVKQMEEMADEEEERNNAMQYVLANIDRIESVSEDTLVLAMEMIIDFTGIHTFFDDAKENIFKSSQDIWSNLDNMAFIDNMERFYQERKEAEIVLTTDPTVKYPISYDEACQMRINASSTNGYDLDYAAVLKEKLKDRTVKFYVDFSPARVRFYRQYAQGWRDISDRNKFIMNISDEELSEYIKSSQQSGSSISKNDLIGKWERKAGGMNDFCYEFMANDSLCRKQIQHVAYPVWSGEVIVSIIYGGKWHLKNDTLVLVYNPASVDVQLDSSHITYRPEMRDSVIHLISRYIDVERAKKNLRKSVEKHTRDSVPVTTNKSRDKIEMVAGHSGDEVTTHYLKRIK
ncbi:MAG: hypothetical protein IJ069_04495 [Prevotella sp.]|nr:hypothetical protein [Prevotella sp.]MBQ8715208.1 hypothetical protein [Prevotella sp.]